jgi:hypothetical protein
LILPILRRNNTDKIGDGLPFWDLDYTAQFLEANTKPVVFKSCKAEKTDSTNEINNLITIYKCILI